MLVGRVWGFRAQSFYRAWYNSKRLSVEGVRFRAVCVFVGIREV